MKVKATMFNLFTSKGKGKEVIYTSKAWTVH